MLLSRQRHRLMARAILVGLLTGLVAVGFHLSLDYGEALRNRLIDMARQRASFGPWAILWTMSAVVISSGLVMQFSPEAYGSGIPHLKAVLQGRQPFRWLRVLAVKFASTVIGVTGGLVLGRGGPSVHMGGAIGQGVANLWPGKRVLGDSPILVAAGAGAGLSAAFNTPLAGLMFVLEELEWRFASLEFFTAATACLAADMVCRAMLGQYPTFQLTLAGAPPLNLLIAFVPLGILSAILGGLFNRSLLTAQKLILLTFWPRLAWWLALASAVAAVGWLTPDLLGSGQTFVNAIIEGKGPALSTVTLFFVIRFGLTIGSSSSGAAGGIFIPILVLGALLGWGTGEGTHLLFPGLDVDPKLFAVVGMAAYFTGVVHAPWTGIVLIIEMTGNYALILPLFVACFSTLLVADWWGSLPIYEALLQHDLRKDRFNGSSRSNP